MDNLFGLLTDYGVLGLWVVFSIIQNRFLVARMDKQRDSFGVERARWNIERTKFLTMIGRRMSNRTIQDVTDMCESEDEPHSTEPWNEPWSVKYK